MPLSPDEIEAIAQRAARSELKNHTILTRDDVTDVVAEAVKQTLLQLGVDFSQPIEMQRDFQHLRQWRRAGEELRSKGMLAMLTIFLTGVVGLIVVGLKQWISK